MTDKYSLRSLLRKWRRSVTSQERRHATYRIARQALALGLLKPGRRLAVYQAVGSECSLKPLIALALQRGVDVYLPCVDSRRCRLRFTALCALGWWRKNGYGILEYHSRKLLRPSQLDVVLVPLLGFDVLGNRLGQGGGYYDRSFKFRSHRQSFKKPLLIGIAFEGQKCAMVPTNDNDVRLDAVLTEQQHYLPNWRCGLAIARHRNNAV